jgi:hypothetical protein
LPPWQYPEFAGRPTDGLESQDLDGIVVLDGPPGSGKSTLAVEMSTRARGRSRVLHLRAFGFPVFHILLAMAWLRIGQPKVVREYLNKRYHPLSILDSAFRRRIIGFVMALETLSKPISFFGVVVSSVIYPDLVIDEGLVNPLAFYNQVKGENSTMWEDMPSRLYVRFFEVLPKMHSTHLFFVDASDSVLHSRWRQRGHPLPVGNHSLSYIEAWVKIIRDTRLTLNSIFTFEQLDGAEQQSVTTRVNGSTRS